MMHTETIQYFDGEQILLGKLIYRKSQQAERPAILLFPAFEGPSHFALDYAEKLAEKDFVVFVVDMYGDGKTSKNLQECIDWYTPFARDRSLARRRAVLAFEALKKQKGINLNKIGSIGFCFGGTCMLELVRSGANVCAAVSAHGALEKSELETHPIKTKLLILAGYADPQVPISAALPGFVEEMKAAGNHDWIYTLFGDAQHSFTDPATGTFDAEKEKSMGRAYNQRAAEFTFRYAVDFFEAM